MIRVLIQIIPRGDETKARHAGTIEISNRGTGTETRGNYVVRLAKRGQPKSTWRWGEVKNFPRLSLGPYDLLLRALVATVGDRQVRVVEALTEAWRAEQAQEEQQHG